MEDKEEKNDYEEENREYMKEILQTINRQSLGLTRAGSIKIGPKKKILNKSFFESNQKKKFVKIFFLK